MKPDLTQSRDAVSRAGRATKLLLAISLALLVALGAIFTHLMLRQSRLQESVREDALWAVYQLDREARVLSQTIDHLGPITVISRNDLEALSLRYDILYSRLSVLEGAKYSRLFVNDEGFDSERKKVREFVLAMEPFFNEIAKTGRANRNLLLPTDAKLTQLLVVTGDLLAYTNARLSAARADGRDELVKLQRLSAFVVMVLALTIGLLLFNLMRQLKTVKQAAGVLENTANELTDAYHAAEAGNRAKSEFMATMGHEIRTPLNAILGMAELIAQSQLDPRDRGHIGIITSSGTALLEMLNEILDFAKIEHGQMTAESVAFDARKLAADAARMVEGRVRERRNRLDVVLDGLPQQAWYTSDPTLLQRVLMNLLSNAVKFTENGIVRLRASETANGERLRFEVADTGIGIAPDSRDRLFAAFSQVDSTISRRFGGTGLGLAICKRIVEGLGGEIGVDSTPGVGSLFWFELPAIRAEAQAPAASATGDSDATLPSLDILVVEDHAINREVAGKFLHIIGQDVTFANDGAEGADRAARHSFDLILMDMQMPVMDGIASAKAIRASGNTVPIVAMTANASDEDRRRCSEAGMNGFESKPITLKRLRAVLGDFSGESRIAQHGREATAVSTPPTSQAGPWDQNRVAELVAAVGEDGLKDLTVMFLADVPALLSQLAGAIESRDPAAMDAALHAIKGAAGNIGLSAIATFAQACRNTPPDPAMTARFAAEVARVDPYQNQIAA